MEPNQKLRKTRKGSRALAIVVAAACFYHAVLGGTPAVAQEGEATAKAPGIEEIIVTARKRKESLQETPISITALSAVALEERSLSNLSEISDFAPNVVMATGLSGGGNNLEIFMRGVGQSDFLVTTDPGVGIYIDGVYHSRTFGAVFDLLDLGRVEVLRGPQGTLFGKNTIGGAISLITQKPTGEFGGYGEVTFGRFNRIDGRGTVNFPVIEDRLFARFSFSTKNRNGYAKRLDFNTGKVIDRQGDEDITSVRGALRWLASDAIEVNIRADVATANGEAAPLTLAFFDDTGQFGGLGGLWNALVGIPNGLPMSSAFITSNPLTTFGTGPNTNSTDIWGISATIDWDASDIIHVKSITAYRENDAAFGRDGDGSPLQYVQTFDQDTQNQFSQEIQLSGVSFNDRLTWIVGGFFFDETATDTNNVRLASGLYAALEALPAAVIPLAPVTCPPPPGVFLPCAGGAGNPFNIAFDLDFDMYNHINITSYAGYTQGTFQVTDKLSVTGGVRYTYEKKDYTLEHKRINSGVFIVPLTTVSDNWSKVSPMSSIEYRWSRDIMTYVKVAQGFKSGGFNGRPILQSAVESFGPETLTSYEAGVKSQLFDRRLILNITGFYNKYKDIQLGSVSSDPSGNLILLIQNAGKATVKGLEAELRARPAAGLDITGGLGYTDFQFDRLNPGVADITLATRPVKTPKWTANASIQYAFPVGEFGLLSLRGDWIYTSSYFQDNIDTPFIKQSGFSRFNARVVFEHVDGGWQVFAFGTNLSDKRYIINGIAALNSFGSAEATYGRPREWGIGVKKQF
jgi:iron complex outermembrane receptor protein